MQTTTKEPTRAELLAQLRAQIDETEKLIADPRMLAYTKRQLTARLNRLKMELNDLTKPRNEISIEPQASITECGIS